MRAMVRRLVWYCAGVEPRVMHDTYSVQAKYEALGTVVLLTGITSCLSGYYAIHSILDPASSGLSNAQGVLIALPLALLWGFIILSLDRFLVMGFNSGNILSRLFRMAGRLALAGAVGFVVALPIELILHETEIENRKRERAQAQLRTYVQEARDNLVEVKRDLVMAKAEYDKASNISIERPGFLAPGQPSIGDQARIATLQQELTNLRATALATGSDLSLEMNEVSEKIDRLERRMNGPVAETRRLNKKAQEVYEAAVMHHEASVKNKLEAYQALTARHKEAELALDLAQKRNQASADENLADNLMNRASAYLACFQDAYKDPEQGRLLAIAKYFWLTLIFVMIDVLPVAFKASFGVDAYSQKLALLAEQEVRTQHARNLVEEAKHQYEVLRKADLDRSYADGIEAQRKEWLEQQQEAYKRLRASLNDFVQKYREDHTAWLRQQLEMGRMSLRGFQQNLEQLFSTSVDHIRPPAKEEKPRSALSLHLGFLVIVVGICAWIFLMKLPGKGIEVRLGMSVGVVSVMGFVKTSVTEAIKKRSAST